MVCPCERSRPLRLAVGFCLEEEPGPTSPPAFRRSSIGSKAAIVVSADAAGKGGYDVVVRESSGESRHRVTVSPDDKARFLALGADAARGVEAAMAFLLDRESKESILGAFDIAVVRRYFPDFDKALPSYLARFGDKGKARHENRDARENA